MEVERQNEEKQFWDKFAPKYDHFLKRVIPTYQVIIAKILPYLNPTQNVLEIATGTGAIALEIAENVNKIHGCDISSEMINIAKEKQRNREIGNADFSVKDAYNLNYPQETFDVIIASNVLHILINPEQVLLSVYSVLRNNGILIAPTYCHGNSFKSKVISNIMSIVGFKAYHKWSIPGFENFIISNRFKVIQNDRIEDTIPLAFVAARKCVD